MNYKTITIKNIREHWRDLLNNNSEVAKWLRETPSDSSRLYIKV